MLLNPPYTLSLIILLWGFILWYQHHKSNSLWWGVFIGLIFSLLSCIKVYSAILIGLSLSVYWLIDLIKTKKFSKFNFYICLSMGFVSIIILKNLGVFDSVSLLEFKPFWFTHSLIESIDKFYWPKLASYRYNQNNFLISIFIELFLIAIFLIGNLGLRILGIIKYLFYFIQKKANNFDLLVLPFLIISLAFPLFFVQKGTAWNTIQFFYYFSFITNLYLASFLTQTYKKSKIFTFGLILLACFGSYGTFKDYFGNPPPSNLPPTEIQSLSFLKNQPFGYVLTYPYDKYIKNNLSTPIPLYAYETSAYVSAFSQKPVFLEDEMNLDITGFDWQKRRTDSLNFFTSNDKYSSRGFLINNNIQYIYLLKDQNFKLSETDLQIDKIYDLNNIKIFNIRR